MCKEQFISEDLRNVIDSLKGIPTEEIKDKLKESAFPYAVMMEQLKGDFNFSTLIRNANAFGAREVFYLGKKRWDRRGSVGSHHYTHVNYLSSLEELRALKETYSVFIGVDNVEGSVPMNTFDWPKNCLLIFGEENSGISSDTLAMCDYIVSITQYGSVRSLNAGTASGIAMYDLTNKVENEKR